MSVTVVCSVVTADELSLTACCCAVAAACAFFRCCLGVGCCLKRLLQLRIFCGQVSFQAVDLSSSSSFSA